MRVVAAILTAGLVFSACAVNPGMIRGELAPTERLLVLREPGAKPLRLVKNDNPAGDGFLRTPSRPVRVDDPALGHLIERMLASVQAVDGVGIAAPQVGVNRRLILVQRLDREPQKPFVAYLNPRIEKLSEETVVDWEGCLSIPAGFGKVKRANWILVSFDRPDGTRTTERVEDFTARIFQHEIDHLDGILFIDRKEPGDLLEEKAYREMRAAQRAKSE